MFRKTVALVMIGCMLWTGAVATGPVWAAEAEAERPERPRMVRTIVGTDDGGWAVVDIRQVQGKVVVVSPLVGREIDLEESNRYALFQGRTVYNEKIDMRLFDMAVPGLQEAVFLKRGKDRFMIHIRFRSGPRILDRTIPLRGEDDLRRLREYIEHFREIQRGEYRLEAKSKLPEDAEYPMYTDEDVAFEEQRPRFGLRWRVPGGVVLKNGEKVQGELLPAFEDGGILIQTDLNTRRVPVEEIDRLQIQGQRRSTAAMGTAFRVGIGSAASGALVGALIGWQADVSVKQTAFLFGAISGALGFISGLMRGARQARGGREFVLGPVGGEQPGDGDEGEERPGRRR